MRKFKTSNSGWIWFSIFFLSFTTILSPPLRADDDDELPIAGEKSTSDDSSSVGIGKFFKLPFHVSVSVRGGYDDNVTSAPFNEFGSAFVEGNLGINYVFGNQRTQLTIDSQIGITDYFAEIPGIAFDFHPSLTLAFTHKFTPRLALTFNSYFTYQQQPDFTNNFIGVNRRSGNYIFTNDKLSLAYQWAPRFSTLSSFTFVGINYSDSAVGTFQNRTENTLGNEFRFLMWPTTSLIAEYRYEFIAYETQTTQSQDSMTHYFLGGVDHSFSPRLSVSVRGGMSFREYDDGTQRTDPYGQGTLNYTVGPHLTLGWTVSYSLQEPDVVGTPARTTLQTNLSGTYKVTPRITTTLSVFYQHDQNDARTFGPFILVPGFAENTLSLAATARYAINRNWGIELGYSLTNVGSDMLIREYTRNRFYGGGNFQF